jgi:WD40 repeat protein
MPGQLASVWSRQLADHAADLRFAPGGRVLAAATLAGTVAVLDASTGELLSEPKGHPGGTLSLAWSPDGSLFATGGQDGRVRVCRPGGEPVFETPSGRAWIEHMAFSPDGLKLAVGAGRMARVYDRSGQLLADQGGHGSTISALCWMGRRLVTACYGGVQLLEFGKPGTPHFLEYTGSILALAPSPDGKWLASGNQDGSLRIWKVDCAAEFAMSGYPTKVKALVFSGDGSTLVAAGGAEVTLWDFSGAGPVGRTPKVLEGHAGTVTAVGWAGHRVLSVSEDGTLRSWPASSDRGEIVWEGRLPLDRLAVAPGGVAAAFADRSGNISLVSLDDR